MKRETVGALSVERASFAPETRNPIELEREMHKDYESHVLQAVERGKKQFPQEPFFIEVTTKNEKLLPNVFRNFFAVRRSCPTPNYDQTLYGYDAVTDEVGFIWVIPSQDACIYLKNNALLVHPSERPLLRFVLMFDDGTLFKMCKMYNKEEIDSPLLRES